jgi:hypothetical protein
MAEIEVLTLSLNSIVLSWLPSHDRSEMSLINTHVPDEDALLIAYQRFVYGCTSPLTTSSLWSQVTMPSNCEKPFTEDG